MSRFLTFVSACLFILLVISCSGTDNPVSPTDPATTGQQTVSDGSINHYLWLYNLIKINPVTLEYEIIPVRGVETHWNVLKWLEQGPCFDCFGLAGMTTNPDGTKDVNVRITHPFTIPNFTGFDVRGIAMFEGSHTFTESGLIMPDRFAGTGELVNADGYTHLYEPGTEGSGPGGLQGYIPGKFEGIPPTSTLNGYMRHISDDTANTRNAFYAGDNIITVYTVDMPDGPFVFGYAVDACWEAPTTKPVTNPMTDFGPGANCPEPWNIEVTNAPIGNGLTTIGGSTELTIDVYDWQGKLTHAIPSIECSEIFPGVLEASFDSNGTGYTRYTVTIENTELPAPGIYRCLISSEDDENGSAPDWLDLTAYQVINLEVTQAPNQPPTALAEATPTEVVTGQNILFNDLSTDPDGADDITNWAWDFNYDGSFNPTGNQKFLVHSYPTAGVYEVMLRVRDTESHEDFLDTPLSITVTFVNQPPVANGIVNDDTPSVGQEVHFTDTSTDPDGAADIVTWEWDFTYNAFDGFQVESNAKNPNWTFNTPGNYDALLRVYDSVDHLDWMDNPIKITVE